MTVSRSAGIDRMVITYPVRVLQVPDAQDHGQHDDDKLDHDSAALLVALHRHEDEARDAAENTVQPSGEAHS